MTNEDEESYNNTNTCWICSKEITEDKVRDHCHITGKYRGAAHKKCNLQLRIPKKLPIIFHNLEGYDGHFIIRELNNFTNINIQVIPKSTEKYMSIIVNKNIIFLDSLQFLKGSLDTLANNLDDNDRKYLLSEFHDTHLQLLKKKDSYPYEWVDDNRKFNYPRLPPKSAFCSRLNLNKRDKDSTISDEEYNHLNNVWQTFNFTKFKDFHIHYLKKDVLLLADVFEKFINTCIKYYSLDPTHYFSAPGLSWDAMLNMTGIKLDKIDDSDMHLFIERGMRGGICVAIQKYCKANNEHCKDYDSNKSRLEIKYDDMNNLYGKAMMSYLPYGSFKWIKVSDKNINTALNKKDNSLHGYFLEVDMHCPNELHDYQNDFPMAPEKLKVTEDMLSKEQIETIKQFDLKIGVNKKLIPNLYPKENYVVHYRTLKYI